MYAPKYCVDYKSDQSDENILIADIFHRDDYGNKTGMKDYILSFGKFSFCFAENSEKLFFRFQYFL